MGTPLHLDLGNLIEVLPIRLSDNEVIWYIPDEGVFHVLAEVVWWPPSAKLSGHELLLIQALGQVELDDLLGRSLLVASVIMASGSPCLVLDALHHLTWSHSSVVVGAILHHLLLHLEVVMSHDCLAEGDGLIIVLGVN